VEIPPVDGQQPIGGDTSCTACSGEQWYDWANIHAVNSYSTATLASSFRPLVEEFIKALEDGGATVEIGSTLRAKMRAYFFHWAWLIHVCGNDPSQAPTSCLEYSSIAAVKCYDGTTSPAVAPCTVDPKIQWDHGNDAASKQGAKIMVEKFGLEVPPESTNTPSLVSKHISGLAIDMKVLWSGTKTFKKKDGTDVDIEWTGTQNSNTALHALGASYGVKKLVTDEPHWSDTGK
jgi:hypothetical protein